MNSGRYNTIFDHTSLRLHPDGTRVSERRQRGKGRDRRVVQDSRGQLTAQDAGGWAPVKRTVRKRSEPTEEDNKDDEDNDTDEENEDEDEVKIVDLASEKHLDEAEGETESENDGGRSGLKSSKAKHRREFVENLSFLESTSRVAVVEDVAGPSEAKISLPSSDLLKSIHYFASTYYDEMGQLYDATRATRRDRKFRKQQMHQASVNAEGYEEEETEDQGQSRAPQRQNRQRKKTSRNIDMYKMLDGTALMAIGMLVEQYVGDLVTGNIPEGWEESMAKMSKVKGKRRQELTGKDEMGSAVGERGDEREEPDSVSDEEEEESSQRSAARTEGPVVQSRPSIVEKEDSDDLVS